MTLLLANLPDDPDQLASWLDQQIVSDRLPRLAGELAACHGMEPSAGGLTNVERRQVVASGVGVLDAEAVTRLLDDPAELMRLQLDVLTSESPHWDAVPADPEMDERVMAGRSAVADWLGEAPAEPVPPREAVELASHARGWFLSPESRLMGLVGVAAGLLAAFNVGRLSAPTPPAPVEWGWNSAAATVADNDRSAYLRGLADSAGDWFKKRPNEPRALAARIHGFRRGCSRLLLMEHPPLTEEDKIWLREKCLAWAEKIDAQLLALERGASPSTVREAMDGVVNKLATAIRARADA